MASFEALRNESTADFGQRTNVAWVKRYLSIPDEDSTLTHEVPIFSLCFQRFGEDIEVPLEHGSAVLTGYKFYSAVMVNLAMHNCQIDEAERVYQYEESMRGMEDPDGTPAPGTVFDPLFQFKQKRLLESWTPAGVNTVAPLSMDEILAAPDQARSGFQIAVSGETKILAYWGTFASGVHYCFLVLKMIDITCQLPEYNVSFSGIQAAPRRATNARVTHVPEWVAVSCLDPVVPDEARAFEFEGKVYFGEVRYVGKIIENPNFDPSSQATGNRWSQTFIRDQRLIDELEHMDILLDMKV
jgi:hypothetical protein